MQPFKLFAWDSTLGQFVRLTVDHATGNLNVTGGGGGGGSGPVTVADGADVAQGTTTDTAAANTVVGVLKAIKAAVQGTLTVATHAVTQSGVWTTARSWTLSSATDSVNVGNFPATQPVSGSVSVSNFPGTQPVSGTVTADTELPPAAVLADTDGNPTTSRVGANGLLWNGTSWDRAPGDKTNGQKVQSAQLPAALGGGGGLKVDGSGTALPVSGTFFQATQPVSLATNTPDVTDRAARLLGVVDKGKVWDGTNIAAVKAASTVAAAADPALVVQHTPQRADASVLAVTATAATGVAATLTIPAAGAGLFHYITYLEISLYATAARTGGATPILVTTTNLPGSPVWDFETAQAIGAMIRQQIPYSTPLKASAANTATTIVAPIATTGIWRITAFYYAAP